MKTIYIKLLEIQKAVDSFVKDKKGHNYNYATGNQVLSKIRPLMNEHGLILKQEITEIRNERIDYQIKSGQKSEMFTTAIQRFTWVDCETGDTDVNEFAANGQNDWDKGLGSALTYAERYFLLKYFHVPTDADDPDAKQVKAEKEYLTPGHKRWESAVKAIKADPSKIDSIKKQFNLTPQFEQQLTNS